MLRANRNSRSPAYTPIIYAILIRFISLILHRGRTVRMRACGGPWGSLVVRLRIDPSPRPATDELTRLLLSKAHSGSARTSRGHLRIYNTLDCDEGQYPRPRLCR